MTTINLQCDRCKKQETVPDRNKSTLGLKVVGIAIPNDNPYGYCVETSKVHNRQEWCAECFTAMGLVYRTNEAKAIKPDPTLDEQILEVVKAFIHENSPSNQ